MQCVQRLAIGFNYTYQMLFLKTEFDVKCLTAEKHNYSDDLLSEITQAGRCGEKVGLLQ